MIWRSIGSQEIQLTDKLGEGDGGVIYHAHWRGLDVVAKMLKADTDRYGVKHVFASIYVPPSNPLFVLHAMKINVSQINVPCITLRWSERSSSIDSDVAKADLINEISVLSRLRHPNVGVWNFLLEFRCSVYDKCLNCW